MKKYISIINNKPIKKLTFLFFRYRSIMPLYYRDAQVALLVYDVTDMSSFNDLNYWIDELDSKVKTDGMII